MVWQRTGTVAVQSGSNTVTGVGVDFAAGSRNGDSFIGPDGATYEIGNVASATVISILPAYKGPSVSGGAYAIMPVQGYDKMLSDAFNSLNNQFGPKLAALGTTGNYDILPVSKGGTGTDTLAKAQLALGIPTTDAPLSAAKGGTGRTAVGTAVSADVTTSPTDTTPGRVTKVGDLGLGLNHTTPMTNINSAVVGSTQFFSSPQTSGTKPFAYGFVDTKAQVNNNFYQIAYEIVTGSGVATRVYSDGAWKDWRPLVQGGADSSITSLSGLTTALSVSQGGTGGNTQATARNSLGLGSAATAAVGTSAGNVMPVGAFGAGADYSTGLTLCTDISGSQVSKTGAYRYAATTAGKPEFGSGYGALQQYSASSDGVGNYGAQLAIDYANTELGFRRLTGSNGWSAWAKVYHTGNTTRAADGTLKAI